MVTQADGSAQQRFHWFVMLIAGEEGAHKRWIRVDQSKNDSVTLAAYDVEHDETMVAAHASLNLKVAQRVRVLGRAEADALLRGGARHGKHGGAKETRGFWRFYYEGSQGVIWVMDSSDRARIEEAREDLHRLLTEHELWDSPLLVMANKQDDPRAMTPRGVTEKLQLYSLANRNWDIVDTQATHPDADEANLHPGLDWL